MTTTTFRFTPSDARLGRHVEHDARSFNYPAPRGTAVVESVLHRHYGRVLNQGNVGSCTGNAMAQSLMATPLRLEHRTMTQRKAVQLYRRATQLDSVPGEYPIEDTGSSGLAVCKAAVEYGYIHRYEWAFGIDHVRAALARGPMILGTVWYEKMFEPDDEGFVSIGGEIAGGHEWLLLGYVGADYLALNSWGKDWGVPGPGVGHGGAFWLSHDTLGDLLAEDGDAVQPVW